MRSALASIARFWSDRRGSALVEVAIALPLLLIVFFATVDFSRALRYGMALTNAARAGAQYCSTSPANSVNTSSTLAVTNNASPSISGVSSSTTGAVCYCATDSGTFTSTACTATCSGGQHLVATCSVTTTGTFTRATPYPGIPASVFMTRTVRMRVTN